MEIRMDGKYRLKGNGGLVRILCIDVKYSHRPIVGLYADEYNREHVCSWRKDGTWNSSEYPLMDLEEVPEEMFIEIGRGESGRLYPSDYIFSKPKRGKWASSITPIGIYKLVKVKE